ncbi:response regulator [Planktothrix sp. FACHB-1355]|uniref:Response regulator n=1 Tax=Aerosakkonema funiforme FACHB-1375 TaxID=2949571 RepID=A0A926VCT7_9CYAN|nr:MULTISPECIES: response regulator [Oscillatoriales]MBD2181421.1 response regulator [Aerosakkonema funiforme FACHB-1375]MBD3557686.1 response regulator [Planktothrix sp. FACHB-1355]
MNQGYPLNRKVLIADDDDDSRTMLAFLLESEGWQIAEARNGKEALEKLTEECPQVLILDNRMPELTGAEVYQHIQQEGIKIPVVLMTAFSDLEELASSLGIRYYLPKPVDVPLVLATVESAYAEYQK